MGISFRPGTASWSYGGFHRFREHLMTDLGLELDQMFGFGGTKSWSEVHDPLVLFLNHSDCDGELAPEVCAIVAPRLRELILTWDPLDYDVYAGHNLADAMDECARTQRPLLFC